MWDSKKEIDARKELQGALDKMKRNVEGVGNAKLLKEKYPSAYRKQIEIINSCYKSYISALLEGVTAATSIQKECVETLNKAFTEAKKGLSLYDAEYVKKVVSETIMDLWFKYSQEKLFCIQYDIYIPEEENKAA